MTESRTRASDRSRRAFLGALATGTAALATAGVTAATGGTESRTVEMRSTTFDPVGLHVEPGTTVRFEIADGTHSATAYPDRIPEGAAAFDTAVIADGAVDIPLDVPGTYDYYCIPHEAMGMVGRIVVGTPGGPTTTEPLATGAVPDAARIVEAGAVPSTEFDGDPSTGSPGKDCRGMAHGGMDGGGMGDAGGGMAGAGPGHGHGGQAGGPLLPLGIGLGSLGTVGGLAYWVSARSDGHSEEALETLDRRLAAGEIDAETYDRRRAVLGERRE